MKSQHHILFSATPLKKSHGILMHQKVILDLQWRIWKGSDNSSHRNLIKSNAIHLTTLVIPLSLSSEKRPALLWVWPSDTVNVTNPGMKLLWEGWEPVCLIWDPWNGWEMDQAPRNYPHLHCLSRLYQLMEPKERDDSFTNINYAVRDAAGHLTSSKDRCMP